jgi:hypothetical protein
MLVLPGLMHFDFFPFFFSFFTLYLLISLIFGFSNPHAHARKNSVRMPIFLG